MSRKPMRGSPLRLAPLFGTMLARRPVSVGKIVAAGSIVATVLVLLGSKSSSMERQRGLLAAGPATQATAVLAVGGLQEGAAVAIEQDRAAAEAANSEQGSAAVVTVTAAAGAGQAGAVAAIEQFEAQRQQMLEMEARPELGKQQQQLELDLGGAKDPGAEQQPEAPEQPQGQLASQAQRGTSVMQLQAQAQEQPAGKGQAADPAAQEDGAQGGMQQGAGTQAQQSMELEASSHAQPANSVHPPKQTQQQQEQGQGQAQHVGATEHPQPSAEGAWPATGDTIHVLVTSSGNPYQSWQMRIMYATFKLVQKMPGGEKMVGFTRILHRGKPDLLMGEVPTFRVDPQTPACDKGWAGCEYPPMDRPNAVHKFMEAAQKDPTLIKAPWLLMAEPDYIWLHPVKAQPAEDPSAKAQFFPFHYMAPAHPDNAAAMRKLYPESSGPLTDISPTGPAPGLMRVQDWLKVAPLWDDAMRRLESDQDAVRTIGWVREMYAFAVACALARIPTELTPPPDSQLLAQPPADPLLGNASALHYTWGTILRDANNKDIWRFDKRDFSGNEFETHVPTLPELPPYQEGMNLGTLNPGFPVHADGLYATLTAMVKQFNRAAATLTDLPGAAEAGAGGAGAAARSA